MLRLQISTRVPVSTVVRLLIMLVFAMVCVIAQPPAAIAAPGFSVTPMRFEVDVNPGASRTVSVDVRNETGGSKTFTVGVEDVEGSASDVGANPVLLGGPVSSPIAAATWLHPESRTFTLSDGDTRKLDIQIKVPASATGGHYAAVTIAAKGTTSDSVTAVSRAAVLMMINAGGVPPPEVVVQEVVTTGPGGTVIDYVNKGRRAATPAARIEYYDVITGEKVGESAVASCTTALPGGSGQCVVGDGALGTGLDDEALLVARPVVVLENDGRRARAEQPLEWAGSWTSMLLPLVGVGLLVLYFGWWRRRRRGDVGSDLSEI